ncbi:MAG TPA: VWA domain-containing protein [bacterium]|nr:VWA domain-containing protein [Candidatus Omnitrophota bacterium]HOJ62516.1 VWA domain-containing protein [bacterium]HOL95714.1 VWA domain-containing protein [bacterium]HPO99142.1 VWA domain-containing protein [bacterium]
MRFAYQGFLVLLLLIPFLAWRYTRRQGAAPLFYSDISRIKKVFAVTGNRPPFSHRFRHVLFAVRLVVLSLFILALARPQAELITSEVFTEGVDIMLTLDVSNSMILIDLDVQKKRTRLDVTKEVVQAFIEGRRYDRIGMLVFATDAFLQCPLTVDYGIVKNFLGEVRIDMIPGNSTAIGNAIAASLNHLRHTESKSKVIILVTDGANNAGQIDPLTAAEMAKALDVKIHSIGVGGRGTPYILQEHPLFGPIMKPVPEAERIDENSLRRIAETTGGKYFRATDTESFKEIFAAIDELEKSQIRSEGNRRFRELFPYFLNPALGLLLIEMVLSNTRFRKLP